MLLTVSKASRKFSCVPPLHFLTRWTDSENLVAFGPETAARYGTGRNYVKNFIFPALSTLSIGNAGSNISEMRRSMPAEFTVMSGSIISF